MTWHVGAIMNEPQDEVLRFAAWYFNAGAHGLTLFFDNPEDPTAEVLESHPDVKVIRCTPAFWEDLGLSQEVRFPKRQNAALTWLYRQAPADWLLNVDADEFMYIPGGIDPFLSGFPPDVESVRVETAEVLLTNNGRADGHYRIKMEREAAKRIYGDAARFFGPKRKGLVGHPQGKSFIRCGIEDLTLRQHWPQRPGDQDIKEIVVPTRSGAALLHHVGDNYEIWRSKLQWRIGSRGFTTPLSKAIEDALEQENSEARLRAIYNELHGCDAERLQRIKDADAYMGVVETPDLVMQKVF